VIVRPIVQAAYDTGQGIERRQRSQTHHT
jgi:hypothetical protein